MQQPRECQTPESEHRVCTKHFAFSWWALMESGFILHGLF